MQINLFTKAADKVVVFLFVLLNLAFLFVRVKREVYKEENARARAPLTIVFTYYK